MKISLNYTIKSIMLLVFIFLTSCEKDLYEDGIQNSSKKIKVSHVSLKDLDRSISSKINEKISTIKKQSVEKNKNQNKIEYDSSLDLYIDTENGKLVDNNGELSYTFPMFRDNEEKLENIIFKTLSNGEIETYISKYNVKPEEFNDLTYEQSSTLEPVLQKMIFNSWYIICVESQILTGYTPIDNGDLTGNFGYEPVWETNGSMCYLIDNTGVSSGGTSGNSGSGANGNSGPTGNGGGTTTGNGGVTTSPAISPKELLIKKFVKQLTGGTGGQKACFDGLSDDKKAKILDFLGSNATPTLSDCPDIPTDDEELFNFTEAVISSQCGPNAEEDWNDFENQFLTPSEGQDFLHNENYWNNPLVSFPQQDLPSYVDYYNGMPRDVNGDFMIGADNVYGLVGGEVLNIRNQYPIQTNNTCALKVSIALTRSGITIPNIPGETVEGGGIEFTGKYFFLNARSLNAWMRETFGTNPATSTTPLNNNHLSFEECDGGKNGILFGNLLNNKFGIYSMITKTSYSNNGGASGHADLLFPSSSGNTGTTIYGPSFNLPIERIDVWILN